MPLCYFTAQEKRLVKMQLKIHLQQRVSTRILVELRTPAAVEEEAAEEEEAVEEEQEEEEDLQGLGALFG